MNTVQIISLLAAAAFFAQPFVAQYLKKSQQSKEPIKIDEGMLKGPALPEISYVVSQWATLKSACDDLNLKEASSALDSIFPLFVKKG